MRFIPCLLFLTFASASSGAEARWWRGNTHTHTTLCGHADSTPDAVAKWYLDQGYQFLCLSEHDQFIDPKSVNLPAGHRKDFLLIPGIELQNGLHPHDGAQRQDGRGLFRRLGGGHLPDWRR